MQCFCTDFSFRQMNMAYSLGVHRTDLCNGNVGGLYSSGPWFEFLFGCGLFCEASGGVSESAPVNSRVIP
jgi:hypothetical protein